MRELLQFMFMKIPDDDDYPLVNYHITIDRVATVRFSSVSSNLTGVTLGSVTVRFGSNWYG